MKNISEYLDFPLLKPIRFLLTDIDDTMTTDGQLSPESYAALFKLQRAGIKVIPITGRPAGWCEMIARLWPVAGVVGENGGFYFHYSDKKMHRWFYQSTQTRATNQKKLETIQTEILKQVPGAQISSDQFCRLTDLAIDFCEDVEPLTQSDVQKIVQIFESYQAVAKISSIHVNGWFGTHTKLSTSLMMLNDLFALTPDEAQQVCAYAGDSPNDEPMFEFFPFAFGVANVRDFKHQMKSLPQFVSNYKNGAGFCEIVDYLEKK
ncbi:MAG: HAD-IIB family hydrolase [Bdellovibrionaceae bacterium]|nr:HAD-IIB family hydrolase [Pseudobdellovibrionaceae bacterium]